MRTITLEQLADLRRKAALGVVTYDPAVVLALLDRIETLEEHNALVMERNTELKERLKSFAPEETFK